ncbi:hypothetical protein [Actinoplanes palleronii]|uniref:Uncharacterized protein n=1 Tax=Actinoplanes palleronii TaxID=113570 RepID=A0ABQ4BT61_9ACTN|nr:hypothetical protein [Actinoplanes palleronii]GIE73869.1 hypothetical protein Apa02nite_099770 [Actinoplanes palleronii]
MLTEGRVTVDPMSPILARQVAFLVPTPKPGRSPQWNDPPATTAAGSWGVSVLGADLMSGQVVTLEMEMDNISPDTVISDVLEFDVYERDAGWAFSLPLKPRNSGELPFNKCPAAQG